MVPIPGRDGYSFPDEAHLRAPRPFLSRHGRMTRRRNLLRISPGCESLERRETPSNLLHPPPGGQIRAARPADFQKPFINLVNTRFLSSQLVAARVSQAFQLFEQNALGIPPRTSGIPGSGPGTGNDSPVQFRQGEGIQAPIVPVSVGVLPDPPTLTNLIDQLRSFTDQALTTTVDRGQNFSPSSRKAPRNAPLTPDALVPFANMQIDAIEQAFITNPPVFKPDGTLVDATPKRAIDTAFNAILNAVAEQSVYPQLFRKPSDFYINPDATFTIPFSGTPANQAAGFFQLGPGGVPLPGARFPAHAG